MTFVRRPASRFFAAFYRWNVHNQRTHQCAAVSKSNHDISRAIAVRRHAYHATRSCYQQSAHQQDDIHEAFLKDAESVEEPGLRIRKIPVKHVENTDSARQDTVQQQFDHVKGSFGTERESPESKLSSGEANRSFLEAATKYTTFSDARSDVQGLKEHVRTLMRKVPSSVAIITVRHRDHSTQQYVPMGMPVSSLTTVTMDPPTISFNIKQPSQTLDGIREADGSFRVHFLGASLQAGSIVGMFSTGNSEENYQKRTSNIGLHIPSGKHDDGHAGLSRAPVIFDQSVRAAMECILTQEMVVEDHVILVAKVITLGSRRPDEATLMYFDRACMHPGRKVVDPDKQRSGTENTSSGLTSGISQIGEDESHRLEATEKAVLEVWKYPLLLGPEVRQEYLNDITEYMRARPKPETMTVPEYAHRIQNTVPLHPGHFGISTAKIATKLVEEARDPLEVNRAYANDLLLADFYGRLDPSALASLGERAVRLIEGDKHYLSQDWGFLLMNLGVSPQVVNLLPSDIMVPLRKAGLVDPFCTEPSSNQPSAPKTNLEAMERIEYRLIQRMASLDFDGAVRRGMGKLLVTVGGKEVAKRHFSRPRARLLALAFPEMFDSSRIDISCHVTDRDARVIIRRICNYISTHGIQDLAQNLNEILRKLRIHPCVTGIDIEFIFAKLEHLHKSNQDKSDPELLEKQMEDMLSPYFAYETTWQQLSTRVREFVQHHTLRAMTWDHKDKLAAMELHWDAVMVAPNAPGGKQELASGNVLDVMFAKELKDLYGNGGAEIDAEIKEFLLRKFGFDVDGSQAKDGEGVKERPE